MVNKTLPSGHAVIEAALTKALQGNPADAAFPLLGEAAPGYMQGLAAAYQHALEMIPEPKPAEPLSEDRILQIIQTAGLDLQGRISLTYEGSDGAVKPTAVAKALVRRLEAALAA